MVDCNALTVVSEEQALVAARWLIVINTLTVVSEEQALVAARWLIVMC